MTHEPTSQDSSQTSVFVSYSRKDAAFVGRLVTTLEARGYAPICLDRSDRQYDDPDFRLTAQDEWWKSLKAMLAASDVMVFVVTPDSAASAVCDDEIAYARSLGRRVIAILRRDVDFNTIPERLRALNIRIDIRRDDAPSFLAAFDLLAAEIELDIELAPPRRTVDSSSQPLARGGRARGTFIAHRCDRRGRCLGRAPPPKCAGAWTVIARLSGREP